MLGFPLNIFLNLFNTIFSVGLIVLQVYLFRKWYEGAEYANLYLLSGIFSTLVTLFGRNIVLAFLRKSDTDEPNEFRSTEFTDLETSDGTKMRIDYFGPENAEKTLIFIPGCSADSTQWYYVKKALQDKYRLLMLDIPGCGLSEEPKNSDYSLERYAKDLDMVVNTCKKPPILIGHSMGTMIIMEYYRFFLRDNKTKVKAIVLSNPTYTNPLKTAIFAPLLKFLEKPLLVPSLYIQSLIPGVFKIMNILSYLNGSLHLSVAFTGFAGTQTRQELDFATKYGLKTPIKTVAQNTLSMLKYEVTDLLSEVSIPTQIIVATKDKMTKIEAGEFMSEKMPNTTLTIIQNASHMALLEKHDTYTKELGNFLEKIA